MDEQTRRELSNVRRLRKEKGLTQAELAIKADVAPSLIQKLEAGRVQMGNITAKAFVGIKWALGCSDADLLGYNPISRTAYHIDPGQNTLWDDF